MFGDERMARVEIDRGVVHPRVGRKVGGDESADFKHSKKGEGSGGELKETVSRAEEREENEPKRVGLGVLALNA